jgi:hypothetical protein
MKISATTTAGKPLTCTVLLFKTSPEEALRKRARGEFGEMPGMRLSIAQAMRLWDLDRQACQSLLNSLVESGFLEVGSDGRYTRTQWP